MYRRKNIRLKGYDYSQEGLYFITICTRKKEHRFGYIDNGEMVLNEFGKIADAEWKNLAERFPGTEQDVFVVMPNHVHAVINIVERSPISAGPAVTIADIAGAYKSIVANNCLEVYSSKNETMGKLWQRNYYEHIIRNERSYQLIADYIINNPANWETDRFYSVKVTQL